MKSKTGRSAPVAITSYRRRHLGRAFGARRLSVELLESRTLLSGTTQTLDLSADETARLVVYVSGEQIDIPANVGVQADDSTADVFTVDTTGTLYIDPAAGATLGDFFNIWRTDAGLAGNNPYATLSDQELFGNVTDTINTVQMFINGQISNDFDQYALQGGDQIVLIYGSDPVVSLNTNVGPIVIELFQTETPGTVDNFLNYVNEGDYINTFFHRAAESGTAPDTEEFVIQAGGFTSVYPNFVSVDQFSPVPTDPPIWNEPGISNTRGTIGMVKLDGDPNSATSQFFINMRDNSGAPAYLDRQNGGFTVFGKVLDMTVPDAIAALGAQDLDTNSSLFDRVPFTSGDNPELVRVLSISGQGKVSGVKFYDANGNGVRDSDEPGIAGVSVFIDTNGNGVLEVGEIATTTDTNGNYLLHAEPGTYAIRAQVSPGRMATVPDSSGNYTVTVEIGREVTGRDFGEATLDAPSGIDFVAGTLTIVGTNESDGVTLAKGREGMLVVDATFLADGPFEVKAAEVERIIVYLMGGNDNFAIASKLKAPAIVHGGEGDDVLVNGGGPAVLVGDAGIDSLIGGKGRDILIGGLDADLLDGGRGDDILIGGRTSHDKNDEALLAILDEWNSDLSYPERVAALGGGPGYNLVRHGTIDDTVFADGSPDVLTGSQGDNWFFPDPEDQCDAKTKGTNSEEMR